MLAQSNRYWEEGGAPAKGNIRVIEFCPLTFRAAEGCRRRYGEYARNPPHTFFLGGKSFLLTNDFYRLQGVGEGGVSGKKNRVLTIK